MICDRIEIRGEITEEGNPVSVMIFKNKDIDRVSIELDMNDTKMVIDLLTKIRTMAGIIQKEGVEE